MVDTTVSESDLVPESGHLVAEHPSAGKALETLSPWQLIVSRLLRHKLAVVGMVVLALFYLSAIFAPFLTVNDPTQYFDAYQYAPPQLPRFWDDEGFSWQPFYYPLARARDPETLRLVFEPNRDERIYLRFLAKGYSYRLLGLFEADIHLFAGREGEPLFFFGTDGLGRDLYSRNIFASRISLTVGLVGVAVSFVLGSLLGGISGYFGGVVDLVIQRVIEFLMSIPTFPLWMALSAALPRGWPQLKIYFAITVILATTSWTSLARVVRGKLISLRSADYVTAALLSGVSDGKIIVRHLLPGFASYLIVSITLSIPGMILGETGLSFLGLGLQSPTISWGVLLSDAQSVQVVAVYPWILLPGLFVVLAVLAFNFVGDGLRDAADPFKED